MASSCSAYLKILPYLSQPIQRKQVFQTIISLGLKKRVEGMLGSGDGGGVVKKEDEGQNYKDTESCKNIRKALMCSGNFHLGLGTSY